MAQLGKSRNATEDLEALFALAKELLRLDDYDQILDTIVTTSLSILGGERGFLVIKKGDSLDYKVIRNWSIEELTSGKEAVSRTILSNVWQSQEPLHVEDVTGDPRFNTQESIRNLMIRSVLAAPLFIKGEPSGVLYLESRSTKTFFGVEEFALFKKILDVSSHALEACLRRIMLEQRNFLLEKDLLSRYNFQGIVTQDERFLRVLKMVAQAATSDLPVLVQGQSGTGKELIARAIHLNSPRAKKTFLTINCGAISPNLLESELFGHVKGAFTGATQNKTGLIASAHQGTLFLDEVGELPKELQVKLLRTLQFGEVQPVGTPQVQIYNVRFVAATNRDLEEEVEEGTFRQDLLYRLNAVTIELPALRSRSGDIMPLFYHFLRTAADKANRSIPKLPSNIEQILMSYAWPGNIRELENEAKRLLALTPVGEVVEAEHFSPRVVEAQGPERPLATLAEQERALVELHLKAAKDNRTRAAETLGITREGLRKMLKRYKID